MSDDKTIAVYDARVKDYDGLVRRDTPDKHLRLFIAELPKGAHVLDLGCGPGNSAAMIQAEGHNVDATDASAAMVRLATQFINARQATFDEISGSEIYDAIWANFSLLHAERDAFQHHLMALSEALKPNGIFHIGMKIGQGTKRDSIGRLYTYYTQSELTKLLEDAGLQVFYSDIGEGAGLSGSIDPFVILRARKSA